MGASDRFDLLDHAMDPVLTRDDLRGFDGAGHEQQQLTDYTYDNFGNVTGVHDGNETETTGDDTYTALTYSGLCATQGRPCPGRGRELGVGAADRHGLRQRPARGRGHATP